MGFKETIGKLAVGFGKSTKNLVGISKLNLEKNSINDKIKKIKLEMGEIIYEEHQNGTKREVNFVERCIQIDEYNEKIIELDEKIKEIKSIKTCKECKMTYKTEMLFCPNCGEKF